jgi:hypothetical protein
VLPCFAEPCLLSFGKKEGHISLFGAFLQVLIGITLCCRCRKFMFMFQFIMYVHVNGVKRQHQAMVVAFVRRWQVKGTCWGGVGGSLSKFLLG